MKPSRFPAATGAAAAAATIPVVVMVAVSAVSALALAGCSTLKRAAVNQVGNALAQGGSVYASDNDPELVWQAVPFALKTIEGLLADSPRNKNLLLAAASGFTQYAYGALAQEADFAEGRDLARATELRNRARNLYLRALDYGLRGLEVDLPELRSRLRADPAHALEQAKKAHVPLLYWTGAAWGGAISISKDNPELTADQTRAEALMRRALALDESFGAGAIHEFFIAYEGGRATVGGSLDEAHRHFARALELGGGNRASPLVGFAETVSVARQDKAEFKKLLDQALAIDPDKILDARLANLLAQRRARWLLGRMDELFVE
ncbi:MAG TPA: TRAP transporter TatT component family protein [Thermoanaerobaculia bacterium]|nr:TRAP transporter TatT component family protein [Thermoanaerobaculia bacterium]